MTKKQRDELWVEQAKKAGLDELVASIKHFHECKKHGLFHLTKEALAYHKHIIH